MPLIYPRPRGETAGPAKTSRAPADIKEYTNRPVLDGSAANVFADKYIAVHLKALAPGQTYPQLSAQSLTNSTNPKLVQETQTLFGGEALRAGCSRPWGLREPDVLGAHRRPANS
jgi:hypothetical protein